MLTPNIL